MLSTKEAAAKLGVSERRITALISSGRIDASKHSGVWLIDPASIESFVSLGASAKGGRPPKGSGDAEQVFTLMNRQYPVVSLIYNSNHRLFTAITEEHDTQRLPLGACVDSKVDLTHLNHWWRNRGLSKGRPDLQELLESRGINVPEELLVRSLGLSLSDQYWLLPYGKELDWHEINFFEHDFSDASYVNDASHSFMHPDNTSDGNLPKHWIVERGRRYLLKGGGLLNQEPFNEVVATALHQAVLNEGAYVPYTLANWEDKISSKCANFVGPDEEYVPAWYILHAFNQPAHFNSFQHYIACCEQLGVMDVRQSLNEMIVCDAILANSDRHWRNFGLVRNVETLEYRIAPLFDSGTCLWSEVSQADFKRGNLKLTSHPFNENPGRQLSLVDDFSWIDVNALREFPKAALGILAQNPDLDTRMPQLEKTLRDNTQRIINIVEAFA